MIGRLFRGFDAETAATGFGYAWAREIADAVAHVSIRGEPGESTQEKTDFHFLFSIRGSRAGDGVVTNLSLRPYHPVAFGFYEE